MSWQVTGTRHDAYAQANPAQVKIQKPANERGRYLFPALFGKPASMAINYYEPSPTAQSATPSVEQP